MSTDADYQSDQRVFDAYFGIPIDNDPTKGWVKKPIRSLRKLGFYFGCSYENIRRRLKRYIAFQEYADLYSVLPTKIAGTLISGQLNTAPKIIQATDKEILHIKGIGLEYLKIIREIFPYNGEINIPVETTGLKRKIKSQYSKRYYWRTSKKWRRYHVSAAERKARSMRMKKRWEEKNK